MKLILNIVAIVVVAASAIFSFFRHNKFVALEKERTETIATNKSVTATSDAADADIKKEKEKLAASQAKVEELEQKVASLKSEGSALASEGTKATEELKIQSEEFAELEKALAEVNNILASLGGGVTLETLSDKILEIEADKTAKQAKLEELEVLGTSAEKAVVESRGELEKISTRMVERSSRIAKNSMEAVVTAVNQDWGFLVIGAGSNSGFTPQTGLLVERDGQMIGEVRPSSIEPNQTIAEINLESLASGVRLQPGDRVILAKPAAN